jgi:stress response protein YsnF
MLTEQELSAAVGTTAYGRDGDKIGTVEHFFLDDRTGAPTWVAVTTGLFGSRHSVVPAVAATFTDGALRLPVTRDAVKSAPDVGSEHLAPADEVALRRHYGLDDEAAGAPTWTPTAQGVVPVGATGDAEEAPAASPAEFPASSTAEGAETDSAMTRSEERLRVSTERVATTRVRLVKYVVTEEVQVTVPVRREEIRVEEVPIDAPDDVRGESLVHEPRHAAEPPDSPELPDEVILHAERPVVSVEVVPVERVRLRLDVVAGEQRVTERLQREQIVVEQTPSPGGTGG